LLHTDETTARGFFYLHPEAKATSNEQSLPEPTSNMLVPAHVPCLVIGHAARSPLPLPLRCSLLSLFSPSAPSSPREAIWSCPVTGGWTWHRIPNSHMITRLARCCPPPCPTPSCYWPQKGSAGSRWPVSSDVCQARSAQSPAGQHQIKTPPPPSMSLKGSQVSKRLPTRLSSERVKDAAT
jgi:hypothetical protein